jgi:Flp pilus assembly protein TadB
MPGIFIFTFVPVFGAVLASLLLLNHYLLARQKTAMTSALREVRLPAYKPLFPVLTAPGKIALSGILAGLNPAGRIDLWIRQAGLSWTASAVILAMGICALCGAVLGTRLHVLLYPALSIAGLAIATGLAPLVPLLAKRRKRMREFERFAVRGKVRATRAHGRLTGYILTAMPLCIAIFLMLTSPEYLLPLRTDPLGKYLILGAIAGQIAGFLCIRKIVAFEV